MIVISAGELSYAIIHSYFYKLILTSLDSFATEINPIIIRVIIFKTFTKFKKVLITARARWAARSVGSVLAYNPGQRNFIWQGWTTGRSIDPGQPQPVDPICLWEHRILKSKVSLQHFYIATSNVDSLWFESSLIINNCGVC